MMDSRPPEQRRSFDNPFVNRGNSGFIALEGRSFGGADVSSTSGFTGESWMRIPDFRCRAGNLLVGLCLSCALPSGAFAQSAQFLGSQVTVTPSASQVVAVDKAGTAFLIGPGGSVIAVPSGGGTPMTISGVTGPISAIAVDGSDNLYICEASSTVASVIKVPAGGGTGTPLGSGWERPIGIGVDGAGDVFVADEFLNAVVELPAAGGQVTLSTAFDDFLDGLAVDNAGNVFATDYMGEYVKKIPAGGGTPTTIAIGVHVDGVAVDGAGNLFVSTAQNSVIEVPAGGGAQTTLPVTGLSDNLNGVAVDGAGDVFIADPGNDRVVEWSTRAANFVSANVCPTGQSSPAPCSQTLALSFAIPTGGDIGTGGVLTLGAPSLDFTLASGSTCSGHFDSGGTCSAKVTFAPTHAGPREGAIQITDDLGNLLTTTDLYGTGLGPQIAFSNAKQTTVGSELAYPFGIAVDGLGDIFISDTTSNRVVKVPAGGGTQTTVGSGLSDPTGIAVDGAGNLFINDTGNNRTVEVPAGGGAQITVDTGIYAPNIPGGIAVDGAGDLFITATFAGVLELPAGGGTLINVGTGLLNPNGVAIDAAGDVFIADTGNNRVVEVPFGGSAQTTVASGLSGPTGVAVDAAGNVFIADDGNNRVLEIDVAAGTSTTVGTGLSNPTKVALDSAGNVFIADTGNARVLEVPRSQAPSLTFASTEVGKTSTDSPQAVIVQNIGNQPLNLSALSYPADFPEDTAEGGSEDLCTGTSTLSAGQLCNLAVNFAPLNSGSLSESLTINDNSLNLAGAKQSIALSGTGVAGMAATLTSPAPGGTFTGTTITFAWTTATGATAYLLHLGSTGVGSANIDSSGKITGNTVTFNALPANGETIYARLYTYYGATSVQVDYTYTAITATAATLTAPAPGSTFTSNTVTFDWTAVNGATKYLLYLGSTGVGSSNLYASGGVTATTATAINLPGVGETVYARLYTYFGTTAVSADYTYTDVTQSSLTSPTPGTTFTSTSVTFNWNTAAGATKYLLHLGTTGVGSSNVYSSGGITATTTTAVNLLGNGETVYVRLYTYYGTAYASTDYTFTDVSQSSLTTPTPGGTFNSTSVTFDWTPVTGATKYLLHLGSTGVGSSNLDSSGQVAGTTVTLNNLPSNGETIYVRLFTYYGTAYAHTDYTYTALTATPAALTTPSPGSTFTSNTVTFDWSPVTGATKYLLYLGSTGVGSTDLYTSGGTTNTSATASNLPGNGETIYARLITYFGTASVSSDVTYTDVKQSVLTTPSPGSTFTSTSVTFNWTTATGATKYLLHVGSTGVGSSNLDSSGQITGTTLTLNGLPTNGETIYVRLYTFFGTASAYTDYTYTSK